MASSSLTFVLTFVALLFVASISAQATTTTTSSTTGTSTSTGTTTSNTTSTGTSTSGTSTTGTTTGPTPPPASAIYGNVSITFFTNTTTVLTIPLNLPNVGKAITPPKNLVITIINGSIGVTQATLRLVAFDPTKFSGNPYAAPPAIAGTVAIPPGIFAQVISTTTGTVVESFNRPLEVTVSPLTNVAGWSLAFFQPNTTANARPAGNWIRDATTTCSTGGATNYTANILTFKVCKLGQFQLIAPTSALTSTTGPLNAATPLSVSYITLVAMFAFSLLILA